MGSLYPSTSSSLLISLWVPSLSTKMAVHLHSTPSSSSSLHSRTRVSQPPLSCATKLFSGLKLQSASTFGTGKPNLTVEFFNKVHKSVQSRTSDSKSTRARVRMMPIGTPRVPYRTPGEGTWQWVDLWNALYRERVIYIGQHIDEEFSNQLLATMLYLDSIESSKRMFFYINSPGGDLTPSLAIYDTMQSLKSPVGTNCLGFAYNLATFLLAAGEKGNRLAMPLSRIALQSPAGAARGQADDIRNEANELLRIRDYLFSELANKTGQPIDKINKDLRRMKRFNAQEALEYGLIDRILRPPRVKADAPRKDAGTGLETKEIFSRCIGQICRVKLCHEGSRFTIDERPCLNSRWLKIKRWVDLSLNYKPTAVIFDLVLGKDPEKWRDSWNINLAHFSNLMIAKEARSLEVIS